MQVSTLLKYTTEQHAPPHALDVEADILGGLMSDASAWDRVSDIVTEQDFYRLEHQLIFREIARLASNNFPIDVVSVIEALSRSGAFNIHFESGKNLRSYVIGLVANTASTANITRHATVVHELSIIRKLKTVGQEIARIDEDYRDRKAAELLDIAESKMFALAESSERSKKGGLRRLHDLLPAVIDRIEALYHRQNKTEVIGLSTGFHDLDKMTSGLHAGDLVIIAGRPSMGKTAFALNIAENVGIAGKYVAVFSLEMGSEQLVMRMLSSNAGVDQKALQTGAFDKSSWEKIAHALHRLDPAPIFIDETSSITALEIRARCRRLARKEQLDLVVIDYLQLMGTPGNADNNRVAAIAEITRMLKSLARELSVPIVVLSQLSRSPENRTDKRPMMSDLRESGAIEQDADLIMFMFREEYYIKDDRNLANKAECIISKHRNGPVGTVRLTFKGSCARFENADNHDMVDIG